MVIDFHVHTFPDALAERTLVKLAAISGNNPATLGTLSNTRERMREWGVDAFVLQPVATKPTQVRTINDLAAQTVGAVSFGTLFPDGENFRREFDHFLRLGLPGVKLHPDYQGFFVEEPRMFPFYDALEQENIPVLFHAGWDPLSPNLVHATPAGIAEVHQRFPKLTIIAAHLGGLISNADQAELLLGRNVYFDLAMSHRCPDAWYQTILRRHGAERILFGSDCPWSTPQAQLEKLRAAGLSEKEESLILHENAERLLGRTFVK